MAVICWRIGYAIGIKGFYGLVAGWGLLRFFLSPGAAQPKKAEARKKTTRPRLVRARLRVALRFFEWQGRDKKRGQRKEKMGLLLLSRGERPSEALKIILEWLLLRFKKKTMLGKGFCLSAFSCLFEAFERGKIVIVATDPL